MRLFLLIAALAALPSKPAPASDHWTAWAGATTPAAGAARAIGTYANGCVQGAAALPLDGPGWHVLRPQRNRYWGHPQLIAAVRRIAQRIRTETGKSLLVADIAQPRGGPATGHASHQLGLDADIRFQLAGNGVIDAALRAEGMEVSMLAAGMTEVDAALWGKDQVAMLRIAASDAGIDRIFVNPVIKRELCRTVTGDRRWLGKIVPWYGHDGHMHLRAYCPADSPECRSQERLSGDEDCGSELDRWFTTEPFRRRTGPPPAPPKPPASCLAVLRK